MEVARLSSIIINRTFLSNIQRLSYSIILNDYESCFFFFFELGHKLHSIILFSTVRNERAIKKLYDRQPNIHYN